MAGTIVAGSEEARELGRLGGRASAIARAKRAKLRNDVLAKARFEDAADKMAQVIIKAALGEGEFGVLLPKERAQFALKALEYGVGRPRPSEPDAPEEVETQQGIAFSVREENRVLDALAGVEVTDE